ncbi:MULTISPECIES: hypothetical protein [Shewanella]|uniref:Uncharacterized protein n=1 Tax=Shewanella metallivivens TaxID=2872342 RepID=A0ABT5TRQ9_9GAMM|nr:hypothetical protein [Shewanella metallivivens]MDD8061314.1 hypothetical protein [Shewanella metallivivens]
MSMNFETLFSPYLTLRLAAFDNMKLIAAVLSEAGEVYQCVEANLLVDTFSEQRNRGYFVQWGDRWLSCGLTHSYASPIVLMTKIDLEQIDVASVTLITVPVMSMQQVGFMCIESAHFDHC